MKVSFIKDGDTSLAKVSGVEPKAKELKKKIADLIYEAHWRIGHSNHNYVDGDFYMENEDKVVEEIIKMVKGNE